MSIVGQTVKTEDWKWARVFMEIVLRAVRRVHYEHGVWGIGRQWIMNREKTPLINMGQGIELADERTVCAAITQEFLQSPAIAGLWLEGDDADQAEERYFAINREQEYKSIPNRKVDIFIQKYVRKSGILTKVPNPSFIEAKRARLWPPQIDTGTAECGDLQIKAVKKDIDKLREEMKVRNSSDSIFCHVLVWGIYETDGGPIEFFSNINDIQVRLHQVRWLPMEWTVPSHTDIANETITTPNITKSLWIGLAQVYETE